ncbi:TPA: helix-turn-helix domain-containing protein [Bacillus cereus]
MLIARQYKLIGVLNQNNRWYTLSELSSSIGYSIKTVQRDIEYIKQYLPENWGIKCVKGKGVYLSKPTDEGIDEIEFIYQRYHINFLIFELLFRELVSTITETSEYLYIQNKTLYEYLKPIKIHLSRFDLKLTTHPLRIQGDEVYIILFYYELYFNIYQKHGWPFLSLSQKELWDYITKIEAALNLKLYSVDKRKISYFLAVLLHRKQQGHRLNFHPTYAGMIKETLFYQKISMISDTLCSLSLQDNDKIIITTLINCANYVPNNSSEYKQELLQSFNEGKQKVFQYAKKFIFLLEQTCRLPLSHDSDFVYCILQHFKKNMYKYHLIPKKIERPINNSMSEVKQRYLQTFQQIEFIYNNLEGFSQFIPKVWEGDILFITIQIEAMRLLSQSISKKVYLYIEDHITWERYIHGVIFKEFGKNIQITPIRSLDNNDSIIYGSNVILTTETILNSTMNIIKISYIPTQRELDNIREYLYGD